MIRLPTVGSTGGRGLGEQDPKRYRSNLGAGEELAYLFADPEIKLHTRGSALECV